VNNNPHDFGSPSLPPDILRFGGIEMETPAKITGFDKRTNYR
jgi:hypothetical protein